MVDKTSILKFQREDKLIGRFKLQIDKEKFIYEQRRDEIQLDAISDDNVNLQILKLD